MKHLEILVIAGELNPSDLGGAEHHIVEVIRGLAEKGHILHVFTGNRDSSSLFKSPRVHVHRIATPKIPHFQSLLFIFTCLRKTSGFLRRKSVDLIHSKAEFPMAFVGARLRKRFKIPHYVTIQNPYSTEEELVIASRFIPKVLETKIKTTLRPFLRYGLQNADLLAAVSRYSKNRAQELSKRPCIVIPNGIDLSQFQPRRTPRPLFTISTTSTLIPRNGLDTLIAAFHLFHAAHPKTELWIAGEGPLKKKLEKQVSNLSLTTSVHFLGTLKPKEIPDLLSRSDVFVRPSRKEGFGVSFIEAMACGIPVIACPNGGILDFIRNGETGLLVPADEPIILAKALKTLKSNPSLRAHLTHHALALVQKKYDWHKIVNQVEKAYNEAILNFQKT